MIGLKSKSKQKNSKIQENKETFNNQDNIQDIKSISFFKNCKLNKSIQTNTGSLAWMIDNFNELKLPPMINYVISDSSDIEYAIKQGLLNINKDKFELSDAVEDMEFNNNNNNNDDGVVRFL